MDKIIEEFPKRLRKRLKTRIKKIILFGSHARGNATESSDYNFFIIVDKRDKFIREEILDESSILASDNDELVTTLIWEDMEWNDKIRYPLGVNILREGKEL